MKKIIISVMVSLFIMFLLPLIMVELLKPQENANSTKTERSDTVQTTKIPV